MSDFANDPRSTSELFAAALRSDDEVAWDAVGALHWRGTQEVFDRSIALAQSQNVKERARAANVLGQLGIPDRTFPDQCFEALLRLMSDDVPDVVFAALMGIQNVDRERAASHVLPFVSDQNSKIRYAVAVALGGVETLDAMVALLTLMKDPRADVRNWATFGVGQQSEADTLEIRSALADRLSDDDSDVRYEAIIGLARHRDIRALGFLKTMLHADPNDVLGRGAALILLGMDEGEQMATNDILGALQRLQRWTMPK